MRNSRIFGWCTLSGNNAGNAVIAGNALAACHKSFASLCLFPTRQPGFACFSNHFSVSEGLQPARPAAARARQLKTSRSGIAQLRSRDRENQSSGTSTLRTVPGLVLTQTRLSKVDRGDLGTKIAQSKRAVLFSRRKPTMSQERN